MPVSSALAVEEMPPVVMKNVSAVLVCGAPIVVLVMPPSSALLVGEMPPVVVRGDSARLVWSTGVEEVVFSVLVEVGRVVDISVSSIEVVVDAALVLVVVLLDVVLTVEVVGTFAAHAQTRRSEPLAGALQMFSSVCMQSPSSLNQQKASSLAVSGFLAHVSPLCDNMGWRQVMNFDGPSENCLACSLCIATIIAGLSHITPCAPHASSQEPPLSDRVHKMEFAVGDRYGASPMIKSSFIAPECTTGQKNEPPLVSPCFTIARNRMLPVPLGGALY